MSGEASARPAPARMTDGPIAGTLFALFLPILLGNLLQALNGSVNAMWVGHTLGEAALAAAANANAVISFVVAMVMGIGMAASILIGQSLGAKDIARAKRVVGTGATFFVGLAVLIALAAAVLTGHIVARMQAPPEVLPLAVAYLRVLFLAMPFQAAYIFLTILLRSTGDSKTPFRFQIVCVGLDIALNPLLIVGWGPLPALGIAGSATATLMAQGIGLMALAGRLYRTRHILCLRADETHLLRPDPRILKALIVKGLPMGLHMAVVSLAMVMTMSLVNRFGAQLSAAYGACLHLWNYIQLPVLAMGMAVTPMAAQNLGARRLDRVGRIALAGIALNVTMAGGMVLVIQCFSGAVLGMFLPARMETLQAAQHINAMVAWSFIPFGVTFVLASIIRASGTAMPPLVILFVALWCIRLPAAAVLMNAWGADALWASFGLGSVSAMLMSMAYYRWAGWRAAFTPIEVSAPVREDQGTARC
ncbi:MATE family efflux transporter [Ralstonia solanacearum]|uniref:MATE family efflux transporter n=1 Tax=Ralstonia solanacearum TaxID=305 RepID=UPI00078B52FD|nr:MATE family efflux transporter [Ralstonia solanacearum]AMP39311.1 MATE family efflux transporter [Ralstonia solanacearum]AXV88147.1 MATE family efflux transporter [Ralstonia solanacearum]AXW07632.1 MATE family efflux transporter [Ralstonia solanacearum]AXW25422.1 MATE family efflux transporter [Ralstonia solanacearum]AXW82334.1 MATE family efflux transporter [Ralstonia solanacearum]